MARSARTKKEVKSSLYKLHYCVRAAAKGDTAAVARLAETFEKSQASLVRHRACFVCGTEQRNPESVRLWEQDRMGSECRQRYPDWRAGSIDPPLEAVAS